jgi:hypothetical protein
MRPPSDADAEYTILTTEAGQALLGEVASVLEPGPADLARWRKRTVPNLVAAALRLARARRRGAIKYTQAERMWLDPVGVQQATSEVVARHKARRFRGACVVDLCAGIGGDTLAIAKGSTGVIAVDSDHGMCRRLAWNAGVYGVSDRILSVRGRAERFPLRASVLVHIDPDRRVGRPGRARSIEAYEPHPAAIRSLCLSTLGGAVKVGPASDYAEHFRDPGFEVELVSLDGECKEATVWFGSLATCGRRATTLPSGVTWTDRDGPVQVRPSVRSAGPWVFDPDPALVRSGLVDTFAAANGLARLSEGVDYLTGDQRLASALLTGFEVIEVQPLDRRRLRRFVADRELGHLEIKVRGIAIRPEHLRAELRPQGRNAATLLVAGGPGAAQVIVARRVVPDHMTVK